MKQKPGKAARADKRKKDAPAPVSRRTLRLTFEYDGDQLRIVNELRVEKVTPPSLTPRPDPATSAGYWVELRDKGGKCLFHRLLPDAIRDSAEIYPENKPLERVPLREVKGRFEVLLPDVPEADMVVVMGHPISSSGLKRHQPCGVLAKFKISGGKGRETL
jgi:hypothetical protein